MNQGRVGEDRGSKEMDRCPLTASFAECIIWQEMQSGKMCLASWSEFKEDFMSVFCLENEATTALMQLKSNHYFQGKQNIEVSINEFKDLINLSGYTNCKSNPNSQREQLLTQD
jgi:hypothetical protein